MAHKNVLIIIPVYRPELKSYEAAALANNLEKLAGYPAVFLKPSGLDLGALHVQYPQVGEVEVSPQWLGTARGIAGYNEMMMSADFYSLFNDYEYILICHVDAWVFRDELDDWCRRGYDHVAALGPPANAIPASHSSNTFGSNSASSLPIRYSIARCSDASATAVSPCAVCRSSVMPV